MSNLQAAIQAIKSEVSMDSNGKVSMTQYGVSKLLVIHQAFLNTSVTGKKLAESLATVGLDVHQLAHGQKLDEAQLTVIIEYFAFDAKNPSTVARQIYRAMAAIGIRSFFQSELGWSKDKPANSVASLREAVEAATKWIDAMEFATSKPGEKNILEYASEPQNRKALGGFMTLKQMVNSIAPELTPNLKDADWKHIGSFVAVTYRNIYGKAPDFIYEKRNTDKGTYFPKTVVYPVDFSPYVQNVLELGFLSR